MKEALLYQPLPTGRIKCTACARYCQIGEGQVGLCGIRGVVNGKLQLLVYGKIIAGHVDPIEKKPVTHYMPGTKIFSIATTGCNWLCHPAGTKILMSDGRKENVEDLLPGDSLWSYETENGMKIVPSIVTHIGSRVAQLWEVRYGARGQGRILLTEEHPLLTESGWSTVKELTVGQRILKVWYQNTEKWKQGRSITMSSTEFNCSVCGSAVKGLEDWNRHRGECYTRDLEKPIELIEEYRQRMKTNNPMKNPEVARRAIESSRRRFLVDPNHGWHRNAERLRTWLHRHPSATQMKLYEILDSLHVSYEKEYVYEPERRISESKSRYILDAAFTEVRFDVEVDGWWHYHDEEVRRQDRIRDETLRLNGWEVLRISGSYLFNHPDEVKALIAQRLAPPLMVNKRSWVEIDEVAPTRGFETVYSIECIPTHNYVADGIVVHNCRYCQNSDISQRRKVEGMDVTPEDVVRMTLEYGCQGIAYTYNQPTIFIEFARDVGVIARKNGIINIFVSNGYDTPDAVNLMNEFLDCITVDFKGNAETQFLRRFVGIPSPEPIFQTLLELRDKTKIHTEITDLVIPNVGDSLEEARKLSKWVYDNLGPDTPMHFLRFHPDYMMMEFPWTPVETLEKHHQVAKDVGLRYVYIGNVPGHPLEHTYCPECGNVAIRRFGFDITGWYLDERNRCLECGYSLPIYGRLHEAVNEQRFLPVIW